MTIQRLPRTCRGCGYRFTPASGDQWYCSASCEGRAALAGAYAAVQRFASRGGAPVTLLVLHGRCRSGKRWFWAALACADPGQPRHKCGDPVCVNGGLHDYGWSATEPEALAAMQAAVAALGGPRTAGPGAFGYYAETARSTLRKLNAAGKPGLGQLKATMLAAHPDKGGSDGEFIAARRTYERARQRTGQA